MSPSPPIDPTELMIINDLPGEECRIAVVDRDHLEELFTERTETATDVSNIYKGRVVNVEPAIQAAFVDYGEGTNGFLHISDLHPRYFPGTERTERVGKKIPRRERPPIQAALRPGQEILVQVLKQGVGTKGPTLTSYLSIPGRLLVLMPNMDRVGVSRKVEDEERRREMRQILDSLDLPEGFGFILRTAGFDRRKGELKQDVAYLMRLWKAMEKRIKSCPAPCELYTESDLLIRTIRDVVRPSIKAIIVDSESAFNRTKEFLRVVAPRSAPKVVRYTAPIPIFHAFDIERQIDLIHSREVPLPSGGRLVIDQTEALVAIDVNSGKSRSARDSETNAYETNVEAADEICRQLRLRDLGGLIVNDLIDMRFMKNRRLIEERFNNNLKRDRAKATALRISDFGILEMTRQRMRPSLRKSHFVPCPHCDGHGEIKSPDYVASDAVRHIGYLQHFDRVARIELVCSPRVASVLLSRKRRELVSLEESTGKRVEVRVSDSIAMERVDYYAYDSRNADIDIAKLPAPKPPTVAEVESRDDKASAQGDKKNERGRGRRRGRKKNQETKQEIQAPTPDAAGMVRIHELARELNVPSSEVIDRCVQEPAVQGASHPLASVSPNEAQTIRGMFTNGETSTEPTEKQEAASGGRSRRRRRGRGRGRSNDQPPKSQSEVSSKNSSPTENAEPGVEPVTDAKSDSPKPTDGQPSEKRPRRRRRGRNRPDKPAPSSQTNAENDRSVGPGIAVADKPETVKSKPRKRSLYAAARRSVSPTAREVAEQRED